MTDTSVSKGTIQQRVVDAVNAIEGATAQLVDGKLHVNGQNMEFRFDMREERTSSTFHRRASGKIRVLVGPWGEKEQFPQRKDGTHNYEKMARSLVRHAERERLAIIARCNREDNEVLVDALRDELGLSRYSRPVYLNATTDASRPVHFDLEIKRRMTVQEARDLYAILKAAGLVGDER